jgi:hypothetical protein
VIFRWGYGQYRYSNGNSYTGRFVSDNKHGHGYVQFQTRFLIFSNFDWCYRATGRFVWIVGDMYEGEWIDDEMNGEGVMRYKNGNVYTGALKKNVKHGRGKMTWASGDSYEGEWEAGLLHGKGTFKYSDKGEYEGC